MCKEVAVAEPKKWLAQAEGAMTLATVVLILIALVVYRIVSHL